MKNTGMHLKVRLYLGLVLCLCLCLGMAFGESSPGPVTGAELARWADGLKNQALKTVPENDPTDEAADVEGGILFLYPFADLYADRTEMTEETHLTGVQLSDTDESAFRGLSLTSTPWDVMRLFPNDNPELAGTREEALLYMEEAEGALRWGRVYRDGQRISRIEYGELTPGGDGYHPAILTCSFNDSLLSGIRAEGFNPAVAPLVSEEEKSRTMADLAALRNTAEYKAVPSSRNGQELTPFGPEDLSFSGLDFLTLTPESLPEVFEKEEMDNGDGTSLLRADGDGFTAVFRSGADGGWEIVSLSIESDDMEGPRGVRLGDAFHEDFQRFRSEGRGTDGITEMLYGEENSGPRGVMEIGGADGLALRYVMVSGEKEIELLLRYSLSRLSEIIIYIR